ncbi:TIGR02679 family protein [Kribbella solani]|uniref:TIGR02679 family protein n=1 Tax=Kribbella solani TaxID=236067 RepID=UPI0029C01F25|nr:TIGR02679 family protein [Kribbella solani]
MGVIDEARLQRLLGAEDLAWLVARIRQRLQRGQSLDTTVTLSDATASQRSAVQRLLGRPPVPGRALTVSLPSLDRLLRDSGVSRSGLEAAIIALTGEVIDPRAAVAEQNAAWRRALGPLSAAVEKRPELSAWLAELDRSGLVRRLLGTAPAAEPVLAELAAVVRELPASGELLGGFAARVVGRAHALDDGLPLATLTLSAARALSGLDSGSGAEWRREVWASVGILRDELSATVLTLGLPGHPASATGRALGELREAGQPAVLTLRQVVRDKIRLQAPYVFICENPIVVSAAADRLGPGCAPLVCSNGQPSAAVMHLLRQLTADGTRLLYHGDFDWGGIRIGNVIFDRVSTAPWRFAAEDYQTMTSAVPSQGHALSGAPVAASWDPALKPAMTAAARAIEEEHVLDHLLSDLATGRPAALG